MKTITIIASVVVTLALISYSIGILTEQAKKTLNTIVLTFVTLGVFLDIAATIMMIIGSSNSPFSLHGILGYSSLTLMVTDAVLLWRLKIRSGYGAVPGSLHIFSRIAYIWWVLAYITGALLVAF